MEQHPIPRQITSFEFKLIGFMTVKQFIYLIVFIALGFIVYFLFPIPIINVLFGVTVGSIGAILAFVPYNDRPLDHWLMTLFKKLNSPTQYFYQKQNKPLYFLENLYFIANPHIALTHIESQEKLNAYLSQKTPVTPSSNQLKKQQITQLFNRFNPNQLNSQKETTNKPPTPSLTINSNQPFIYGVVKTNKLFPLPDILIYIKNQQGQLVRLLKTNNKGYFASFKPLPKGEYIFEAKDPKQNHFFDTMNFRLEENNPNPIEIFSKKIL
jgi:hypothetical protein